MPRFNLIALDLDDTLLDDNLQISPRNRSALAKAADLGVTITIATGRMYRSALRFAIDLGIEAPIITYQGALVKNSRTGEVLVDRPVALHLARQVLSAGYKAGVHINIYLNDTLYVDSITPEGQGYADMAGVEMFPVGSLLEFMHGDPTKVLYIAEPVTIDMLYEELTKKFQESLYITRSKPYYLEFMHPKASKGQALKALSEKFGIGPGEVMAFGDSYNDIDMIEFAGFGVAMGNAPDEVKSRAKYVTGTNMKDGVAEVIEKFLLS